MPEIPTGYQVSRVNRITSFGSLVYRGATGGLSGTDVRVICKTDREVDVTGIEYHQMGNLTIVTSGGVVKSNHGDIIVILNQYACAPNGNTINSCIHMEYFNNMVDDKSSNLVGVKQEIEMLDCYRLPLEIRNGLTYLKIRPLTDHDWSILPHVTLTCDEVWDPTIMDFGYDGKDQWFDSVQ